MIMLWQGHKDNDDVFMDTNDRNADDEREEVISIIEASEVSKEEEEEEES